MLAVYKMVLKVPLSTHNNTVFQQHLFAKAQAGYI